MAFEYKINATIPSEKIGVVERYCGSEVSTAFIVGYDCCGTYQLYDVDVKLKSGGTIRISIPVGDLNK